MWTHRREKNVTDREYTSTPSASACPPSGFLVSRVRRAEKNQAHQVRISCKIARNSAFGTRHRVRYVRTKGSHFSKRPDSPVREALARSASIAVSARESNGSLKSAFSWPLAHMHALSRNKVARIQALIERSLRPRHFPAKGFSRATPVHSTAPRRSESKRRLSRPSFRSPSLSLQFVQLFGKRHAASMRAAVRPRRAAPSQSSEALAVPPRIRRHSTPSLATQISRFVPRSNCRRAGNT